MITVEMREAALQQDHPLDELAVDCSSGVSSPECQLAARSNSYDGHADTLSADALLQYIKVRLSIAWMASSFYNSPAAVYPPAPWTH
jgi:hypothetical protein